MAITRSITVEAGLLRIDGRRTLLRPAEIHNSSSSTKAAISTSFARVAALGADTVLAPVAWDLLEPEENSFDYELVDHMVLCAQENGLALIPLWFGSWKNAESSYAPSWVKRDPERFPRIVTASGPVEVLSPFSPSNLEADAEAFLALTRRLAQVGPDTVVMVQVENEVGLLGGTRDRSPRAEALWADSVPDRLLRVVRQCPELAVHHEWVANGSRTGGTWPEMFGEGDAADEAFMAYGFACYVDRIAAQGTAVLPVPMFVNAWLDAEVQVTEQLAQGAPAVAVAGGQRPGDYPSGGPVLRVMEIWREFAPSLSFVAPDIYFGDVDAFMGGYARRAGALFIPEMRRDDLGAAQMFTAVGEHGAIGASPFGADSFRTVEEASALTDAYELLAVLGSVLADREDARMHGFRLDADHPSDGCLFGDLTLEVTTEDPWGITEPTYPAYAILVEERPGQILALGRGFTLRCHRSGTRALVMSADELGVGADLGRVVRRLGGDETAAGTAIRFLPLDRGQGSGTFPIAGIAEFSGAVRINYYVPAG